MSFDFKSFRRLLYQNALQDAITMLGRQGPEGYKVIAGRISKQLSAWRKSSPWNPFRNRRKSKYHESIVHNLYQSGLAASKGEPPPSLSRVNPWWKLLTGYGVIVILLGAGLYFTMHKPVCPIIDHGKDITIIIDKFGSLHEPLLQKIGLGGEPFEKQIEGALSLQNVSVKVYPVNVANKDQAKSRCYDCGVTMVIWGNVEYGDSVRAYLYHYLNQENYDSYLLTDGMVNIEEHYKNVFGLRTGQWIGRVECLIKLFQGLIEKEKFRTNTDARIRGDAVKEANRLFTDLSSCAIDDSLKIFALQCKAWSELNMDNKEEALNTFHQVLDIDPDNALALNNTGILYLKQNDNLHAQRQFEKILEKNDVPAIRLANAEALSNLHREDEAKKEIEHVEKSEDYKIHKEIYDGKINTIPVSSLQNGAKVTSISPSLSLSSITSQFNGGETEKAIKNLDLLAARKDTTFSNEDLSVMIDIYKNAGATEKAAALNTKAAAMGTVIPSTSKQLIKVVKTKPFHQ